MIDRYQYQYQQVLLMVYHSLDIVVLLIEEFDFQQNPRRI